MNCLFNLYYNNIGEMDVQKVFNIDIFVWCIFNYYYYMVEDIVYNFDN